jgi:hypothetical protein
MLQKGEILVAISRSFYEREPFKIMCELRVTMYEPTGRTIVSTSQDYPDLF